MIARVVVSNMPKPPSSAPEAIRLDQRSARSAQRSAAAGRPVSAQRYAARAAIAGCRSTACRASSQSNQPMRVDQRPDVYIDVVKAIASRATRSTSSAL
jgi:hypothetical protein